jgi:mRNA interferase MazF
MKRGEVYLVNLSPAVGTEIRENHRCIIVQSDLIEHELRPRTIVVPLTSTEPRRPLPFVVPVDPPEGGLKHRSYALCDQVTRIDKQRIIKLCGPSLSSSVMTRIEEALRLVLDL